MTQLLSSTPVVEQSVKDLQDKVSHLKEKGVTPSMKVILVGDNKASVLYTSNKKKFCSKIGAECEIIKLSKEIKEDEFLAEVKSITDNPLVHGCFVQLPLPSQLQHIDVGSLIPPEKDVDGFNQSNLVSLLKGDCGEEALIPCTPKGIVELLKFYNIEVKGKNVVIIGRSLIVGKPMSLLLTNLNATITLCHSKTDNIEKYTKEADIIVSAVGKPKFLNKEYLSDKKPVIIDVGINHDENGKLCGDVDFDDVFEEVAAISPVPKGVGPMTINSLAENLILAAERSIKN